MSYSSQYPSGSQSGGFDRGDSITQLNSLLRGEISASETYQKAMDSLSDSKHADEASVALLREIEEEHRRACASLRERVEELGGEPSESSGTWGVWASTVQSTANLLGDKSALKALKEGEEHGLKDYMEARDDVDPVSRQIIDSQLIPTQQRHINLLDQLINSVDVD